MNSPWRQSPRNRNHPSSTTLHEIGAASNSLFCCGAQTPHEALGTADLDRLAPTDTSTEEEAWQALRVLKGEAFTRRILRRYVLNARKEPSH